MGGWARSRRYQVIAAVLIVFLVYLIVHRHLIGIPQLLFFAVLIPSIIIHEVSHGAVALVFGDDTAKRAGRLTLNPARHVDLFGTLILPAVLLLTTGTAFGYAKPVPVNVARLRHPRNQGLLVSLAGPLVNVVIAVVAGLVLRLFVPVGAIGAVASGSVGNPWVAVVFWLGFANVLLAAFNLIPIPPLDGSAIVERLLPTRWWPGYLAIRRFSLPLVLFVVLLVPGAINAVFQPALRLWGHLL